MLLKKISISVILASISLLFTPLGLLANTNSALENNVDKLKVSVREYHPKEKNFAQAVIACDPTTGDPVTYGITGWRLPSNVHYRINTSNAPSSVRSNFQNIAASSFQTWTGASGGKVSFVYDGKTSSSRARLDFQNTVVWGRTSSNALAVTYTWYYTNTGQVADVDTVFNNRVKWGWTDPSTVNVETQCGPTTSYDVQDVLTHETGHWMGLDDRYAPSEKDLTMYGYASPGELKKELLQTGDLAGIAAIYP